MEETELKPLDPNHDQDSVPDPDPENDQDETDFGGVDAVDDLLRYRDSVRTIHATNDSIIKNVPEDRAGRIRRRAAYRDCEDLFTNILELEPQCADPLFIDYLIDNNILSVSREFSESGLVIDYSVKHLGDDFHTIGRALTEEDSELLRDGIRTHYDEWTKINLDRTLKKAGIITAIGLGVIALVTGLSVGLTRKGSDIVHQAKKWEKLHPAKRRDIIPWTEIEKASGRVIIFAGEYLVVIIIAAGLFSYGYTKRK